MSRTTIRIRGLSVQFEGSDGEFQAVSNVDLTVHPSEFVCILGPSGAGKSTLLRVMAGVLAPTEGTITVQQGDGPERRWNPDDPSPTRALVFQNSNLLPWMSALENVTLPLRIRGVSKAEAEARALDWFGRVGWQGGFLGFPTSDEVAGKGGAYQRFAGGVIYRGPGGAHPVWGDLLSAYGRNGWQDGAMGYPIGDVTGTPGGVYQRFERGVAYWSGATGAHFVTGRFLGRYGADGWQGGARGFPRTDEYVDRGVVRQDFQHGSYWDGPMPAGLYSHGIVQPAGQPNGYFCGPTAGYTVLSNLGAWQSAATGEPLSIDALAGPRYMNTVGYGYTSFNDRRFEYGMNTWLGRTTYYTLHAPSVDQVVTSVMHSYETGYPTVVDEQERRGGPHFNNHSNSTFSHIMVVDSYDSSTGAVSFVDPGYTLWGGAQSIFWYPSLSTFTRTHLQNEVINDGKQHIGIYTS